MVEQFIRQKVSECGRHWEEMMSKRLLARSLSAKRAWCEEWDGTGNHPGKEKWTEYYLNHLSRKQVREACILRWALAGKMDGRLLLWCPPTSTQAIANLSEIETNIKTRRSCSVPWFLLSSSIDQATSSPCTQHRHLKKEKPPSVPPSRTASALVQVTSRRSRADHSSASG